MEGIPGLPGQHGIDAGAMLHRAFQHSSAFAELCAPENHLAQARPLAGNLTTETQWIRSMMDESYLWRQEVPYVDARGAVLGKADPSFALPSYFNALLTPAFKANGRRWDEYSQVASTKAFEAFMSGEEVPGFGIEWAVGSRLSPRHIRVAYVQPDSVAALAGVKRGHALHAVDDKLLDLQDDATIRSAIFPSGTGESHVGKLRLRRTDSSAPRPATLTSGVKRDALPLTAMFKVGARGVGYLLFQEHHALATEKLVDAILKFKTNGIDELVLDLRFNQGGDLSIASRLAYMIAGNDATAGKAFARLRGNRMSEETTMPFHSCRDAGTACSDERALPTLNLRRIYVLTQGNTCAASEALINGLRGVDIDVVQIGGTTCGRPAAATPVGNCGRTFLPLSHVLSNEKGFSGYGEGFEPGGSKANGLPGCQVVDDLGLELGDRKEALLAAALEHMDTGRCPAETGRDSRVPGLVPTAPWREPLRGGAILTTAR